MNNLKMFCLSLYDEHLENLKKINYIPVGLGTRYFSKDWMRDNNGKNISFKNPFYGEHTFHYWLWKNYLDDLPKNNWIGFCAYRRYWANNNQLCHNDLNKIVNNNNFKDLILRKPDKIWKDFETILVEKVPLGKIKFMKALKNGGLNNLILNFKNFFKKKTSIKFHFDIFHGFKKIDKAINLLEKKEKDDFRSFLNNNHEFSRENMFICNSKTLMKNYYKSIFKWLHNCEDIFGFNLKNWNEIRIYGFLAERYLPYWFNKYSRCKEWPFFFFDTHKNRLKI